ncbi:MAG: PKD domain-containing protein [Flavobacteriales bacterium]
MLQYSLDGGSTYANVGAFGDADDCLNAHWYNSNNVVNLTSASPRHGWSGGPSGSCQPGTSGGWVTAKHCLRALAHSPSVRFRFLFGAGSQCNSYDGVAVDDILIEEAPSDAPTVGYSCIGTTVDFSTNTGTGCPTTFAWDFGDPPSGADDHASTENASHTFSGPGAYTISYTQGSACTASSTVELHLTMLDVHLDVQDALCGPGTGAITAVVGNASSPSFTWTPGGGVHGNDHRLGRWQLPRNSERPRCLPPYATGHRTVEPGRHGGARHARGCALLCLRGRIGQRIGDRWHPALSIPMVAGRRGRSHGNKPRGRDLYLHHHG